MQGKNRYPTLLWPLTSAVSSTPGAPFALGISSQRKKKIETLQKLNPEPRYLEMKLDATACKTNLGTAAYRDGTFRCVAH